jgi:hypothetical protein
MQSAEAPLATGPTPAGADTANSAFYREGEYWTIAYAGRVCRLRDVKGMHCLAHLLRNPGEKLSALDLLAFTAPSGRQAPTADIEEARVLVTKRIRAAVKKIQVHHPSLGHHLDTCIKTGAHCVYLPDPDRPLTWERQY